MKVMSHLQQKPEPKTQGLVDVSIPEPVTVRPILSKPSALKSKKRYSVSAINVPVDRLLFNLSIDANRQLSLPSTVKGKVTLIAKNKSIDFIVAQIADQVDAAYEITPYLIKVYPDKAYWHTYHVDYVNLLKITKDETLLNMAVGRDTGGSGTSGNGSTVSMESKHDFWGVLEQNIRILLADGQASSGTQLPQELGVQTGQQASVANDTEVTQSTQTVQTSQAAQGGVGVLINKEAGLISVYARTKKQKRVQAFLEQLARRVNKQVLIEATVVEVELSDRYQAGIDWTALSSDANNNINIAQNTTGANLSSNPMFALNVANTNGSGFSFNLGIKMLSQFGKTKVLSSPKIMTMNNQMALLKVVDNQVYFTVQADTSTGDNGGAAVTTFTTEVHTVPVGFMMSVTPFVSEDDAISLSVRPTLSRIINYVNDPNPSLAQNNIISQVPVIQEREMSAVLRLQDRQTAIIGGLIQDEKSKNNAGVPLLKDIPWLGELFKYRDDRLRKSELVIFIRPVIVRNPDVDFGDLKRLKQFLPKPKNN